MILLPCTWCGPRDATEFAHVGEVSARPDPAEVTPAQWRGYLYFRANPRGWTSETWYHRMGCRRFIRVERHTETNEVRPVPAAAALVTSLPAVSDGAPPARPSDVLPGAPPARRTAREAG